MGEFTSVVCDGDDCYETAHDVGGAMFAHEPSFDGGPEFVTASRLREGFLQMREWHTWCRDCAAEINLDRYRAQGWKITLPNGFVEGVACIVCSRDKEVPWGSIVNDEPFCLPDGSMNPAYRYWTCKECDGTGWTRQPVAGEGVLRA